MKKQNRNGKVKGTVLFTVVTIMMVMVVFLLSTLAITASAQRRTYYTYYQKQAQFACQSALDAISEELYTYQVNPSNAEATNAFEGKTSFYNWVTQTITVPGHENGKAIDIEFEYKEAGANSRVLNLAPQSSTGDTIVSCFIEKLPEKNILWDDEHASVVAQDQWKITATATVGTGRNQAEYTICNYIYQQEPDTETNGNFPENGAAGWVMQDLTNTPSIIPGETHTTVTEEGVDPGSKAHAIYTMSAVHGAASNNLACLGPQTSKINTLPNGRGNYDLYTDYDLSRNDMINVGQYTSVGNFEIVTHSNFYFQEPGEGAVFYGNLNRSSTQRNGTVFKSIFNPAVYKLQLDGESPADFPAIPYNKLAYVYVDGRLTLNHITFGDAGQPVNIYAGCMTATGENMFSGDNYSDIYLYDPEQSSELSGNSGTNLSTFVKNNVSRSDYGKVGIVGGNIVCNNATLTFGSNSEIGGDFLFTNPAGVLTIADGVTLKVHGSFICAGTLQNNGKIVSVDDSGNETNPQRVYVKGQTNPATIDCGLLNVTGMATSSFWTNIFPGYTESYQTAIGTDSAYYYGLFPFCSRLDEIFETYIRWDLASPDSGTANGYINTDSLIKESIAAGHTWSVVQKDSDAGTVYVPCTHPVAGDQSSHSFIKELETVRSASAIGDIPQSLDAFKATFYGGNDIPAVAKASIPKSNVTFISHSADGTGDESMTIADAYIINKPCTIDLAEFAGESRTFLYVDTAAYGPQMPVVLTGGGYLNHTIDFVVNNSSVYPDAAIGVNGVKDYSNPKSYADMVKLPDYKGLKYANRDDCVIFLDNMTQTVTSWDNTGHSSQSVQRFISNNVFNITTTGAYRQLKAGAYDVVSNPYYPGQSGFDGLSIRDRYKYELVPNIEVFGWANETYQAQNGIQVCAEVLMPLSTFYSPSGTAESKAGCTYREYYNSSEYTLESGKYNCNGVGTMCVYDYQGNNIPMCIYVGDYYRQTTTVTKDPDTTVDNWSFGMGEVERSSAKLNGGASGSFGNDHQGAN